MYQGDGEQIDTFRMERAQRVMATGGSGEKELTGYIPSSRFVWFHRVCSGVYVGDWVQHLSCHTVNAGPLLFYAMQIGRVPIFLRILVAFSWNLNVVDPRRAHFKIDRTQLRRRLGYNGRSLVTIPKSES